MPDDFVFEPEEMLRSLAAREVEFVVIGGYGTVLHGSAHFTTDADVAPARSLRNLERLADALRDMHARIRTAAEPDGLDVACDAQFLSRMKMVNLVTRFGALDISFEPAASRGYDDLVKQAVSVHVAGVDVKVASLDDIIHSKETADRPKDRLALPHLYALRDAIAKRNEG